MLYRKTRWLKLLSIACPFLFGINLLIVHVCFAEDMNYRVKNRSDGGYTIEIDVKKTHIISADGFFQKVKNHYIINLVGKGEDWTYRNLKGLYYGQNAISSDKTDWDFGYVWVNTERTSLLSQR